MGIENKVCKESAASGAEASAPSPWHKELFSEAGYEKDEKIVAALYQKRSSQADKLSPEDAGTLIRKQGWGGLEHIQEIVQHMQSSKASDEEMAEFSAYMGFPKDNERDNRGRDLAYKEFHDTLSDCERAELAQLRQPSRPASAPAEAAALKAADLEEAGRLAAMLKDRDPKEPGYMQLSDKQFVLENFPGNKELQDLFLQEQHGGLNDSQKYRYAELTASNDFPHDAVGWALDRANMLDATSITDDERKILQAHQNYDDPILQNEFLQVLRGQPLSLNEAQFFVSREAPLLYANDPDGIIAGLRVKILMGTASPADQLAFRDAIGGVSKSNYIP